MSTPTATRSDAKRNRAKLVASARELFAKGGIDVSVEEITHHAGVGMGTLYRHFPTKDDLIAAVLEEAYAEILGLAEEAAAAEDAWEGLLSFFERALELRVQNRGVRHLLASGKHGERHTQLRKRIRPLMRHVVTRAQEQGSLREDFAPDDITFVFQSVGAVIDAGGQDWRRYLTLLIDGLRTRDA